MKNKSGKINSFCIVAVLFIGLALCFYQCLNPWAYGKYVIELPEKNTDSENSGNNGEMTENSSGFMGVVSVGNGNVLSLIKNIKRPETYSFTAECTLYYGEKSEILKSKCYALNGYSKTERLNSDDDVTINIITGKEKTFIWQQGTEEYCEVKKGIISADDMLGMPTYEDVFTLDSNRILDSDYTTLDGNGCVFIEYSDEITDYTEQFWISEDTGLLICAKSFDADQNIIYQFRITDFSNEVSGKEFMLPDGTAVWEEENGLLTALKRGKSTKMVKNTAKNMINRYFSHEVARTASCFAYYFLFSFFPMLIFLNSLAGYFGYSLEEFVRGLSVVPADVRTIAVECIRHISRNQSTTLMITGITVSIWSASIAVRELFRAVSRAAGEEKYKQTFARFFWSVVFMIMLYIQIFLILAVFVALEYFVAFAGKYFPIIFEYAQIISNIRLIIAAVVGAVSLVILYMLAPGKKVNITYALPGALTAEAAWLVVSSLFSFYASNMARYSILYGSIGALIILMLYFFLTAVILVMGGEFNQVISDLKKFGRK